MALCGKSISGDSILQKLSNPVSSCLMQKRSYTLNNYEFIRIVGEDAIGFLQGQLSCNTELLSESRSLPGALCNIKGRVIADLRLLKVTEGLLLQCEQGMAHLVVETLAKYAVFSKVEIIELTTGAPHVLGLMGENIEAALDVLGVSHPQSTDSVCQGSDCSAIRLAGPVSRVEVWFHSPQARDNFQNASGIEDSGDLLEWKRADIQAGVVHVNPEMSGEYTPQLLNYDISGLIDFKKGCYTGQEIVARMYYRGSAKKRMHLATASKPVSDASSVLTLDEDGNGIGKEAEILVYDNSEQPSLLLAILDSESVDSGRKFRLSDESGSEIIPQSLPYALGD